MPLATRVKFGSFELDTQTGEFWKDGGPIHLQEKPFEVLTVLLERAGEVVSRSDLQRRVWPEEAYLDFDHSINVAVSKLREALEDSAETPRFIETLPRRGYRFIAPLESDRTDRKFSSPRWRWVWGALAGLSLVVVLGLLLGSGRLPSGENVPEASPVEPIESLAVLPLLNLSGNPGEKYIAEGITGNIISELGSIESLRVISWQSVLQFKESSDSLPDIARALDVEAVMVGSMRISGDTVLVDVQLIGFEPERHLWTQTYVESRESLIELERRVARAIAREIQVAITEQERERLERPVTVVPAAFDAYLRGLHAWNEFSKPGFEVAIENFELAVTLDPGFAAAWSGLADSWSMLAWYGFAPPDDAFPEAELAARRALELDPGSGRAHNSLAAVMTCYRWEFEAAHQLALEATELSPGNALAQNWYSWLLASEGLVEEAIERARLAQRLDPMSAAINTSVGVRLYEARRFDEAIDQLRLTLEMTPEFLPAMLFLGMTYQRVGLHDRAIDVLEESVSLSHGTPAFEAALAAALAAADRRDEAREALARVLEAPDGGGTAEFQVATAFMSLGDFDRAFEWLERSYQMRSPSMHRIGIEPILDPLRDDPRFADLRRRVGI